VNALHELFGLESALAPEAEVTRLSEHRRRPA